MIETITAPTVSSPASPARGRRPLLQQGADGAPSIMVVGARAGDRRILVNLLRSALYRTTEVADGAGALAAALRSPPDLVVTRTRMPSMGGEELVRRMRMETSLAHIPVVFHDSPRRGDCRKGLPDGPGVKTVLAKHSDPEAVFEAVVQLLGPAERPLPVAPVAPRGMLPTRVAPLRGRTVAACIGDLRSLQEEIRRLREEGHGAAARRERHRALSAGMNAAEARLATVQSKIASLVELGMGLMGSCDPDSLVDLLAGAANDILGGGRAAADPDALPPPGADPVQAFTEFPGPLRAGVLPRIPPVMAAAADPPAAPGLLEPTATVEPLHIIDEVLVLAPGLASRFRPPEEEVQRLAAIGVRTGVLLSQAAASGSLGQGCGSLLEGDGEGIVIAGARRRVLDPANARMSLVGVPPLGRNRTRERRFETPVQFEAADISTFRRILRTQVTVGTLGEGPLDRNGKPIRVKVHVRAVVTPTGSAPVIEGLALGLAKK